MTVVALTIAGSDSGGGAGVQADLKTFSALGVYGASVLTAVTAQNTIGVDAVEDVSVSMVAAQMHAVLGDLAIKVIKIGMLSRRDTIETVADGLQAYGGAIVFDPVMVATSGDRLLRDDAVAVLISRLMPRADLITPNLHEAAILTGMPVAATVEAAVDQARAMQAQGARAVLIKGGHGNSRECLDILIEADGALHQFARPRVETTNDHGTGCTLSAAIAAQLALGDTLAQATLKAGDYLHKALKAGSALAIGKGRGPVNHFFAHQLSTGYAVSYRDSLSDDL